MRVGTRGASGSGLMISQLAIGPKLRILVLRPNVNPAITAEVRARSWCYMDMPAFAEGASES